ncbi:unnamed protein product [Lactuca saligna]|uniref:Uncharacterized protein n=1 Tax=Lactuca saligna TaxID=75948 RepID=A0AA35YC86_LACSI|nr:unnamed protein product [Lactuca saligna]
MWGFPWHWAKTMWEFPWHPVIDIHQELLLLRFSSKKDSASDLHSQPPPSLRSVRCSPFTIEDVIVGALTLLNFNGYSLNVGFTQGRRVSVTEFNRPAKKSSQERGKEGIWLKHIQRLTPCSYGTRWLLFWNILT